MVVQFVVSFEVQEWPRLVEVSGSLGAAIMGLVLEMSGWEIPSGIISLISGHVPRL